MPPIEEHVLFPSDEKTKFGDWVKAGALKAGDELSIRGGVDLEAGDKVVTVQSITKVDGPQRVYNLEVASLDGQITHNYFVGEDEIWTHNQGLGGNPFQGKNPSQIRDIFIGKGFVPRGPDPLNGKGGFVNPKTGKSSHIDPGGCFKKGFEPPHVDANFRRGQGPSGKKKRKFFL